MLTPFLLIYCICLTFANKYTMDYCEFCKNKYYTTCKRENDIVISCINYTSTAMTPKIQDVIVTLHNHFRNVVASGIEKRGNPGPQPPAENMFLLRWDNELEAKAQRWANHCLPMLEENQQDECKAADRFQVGEYVIKIIEDVQPLTNEKIAIEIILQWYNEVVHVNFNAAASFQSSVSKSKKYSHYSRMIWALAKYVGCAYTSLIEQPLKSKMDIKLNRLICHYGTSRNMPSSFLYKTGKPCSNCAAKCHKKYRALCDDETANNYSAINISSEPNHVTIAREKKTTLPSYLLEQSTSGFQTIYSFDGIKNNHAIDQEHSSNVLQKLNNNTVLSTKLEAEKRRRKQLRMPQYRVKHFIPSPQTLYDYEVSNIFTTQQETLRKWSNKTKINSTVQKVNNNNRPNVLNVFEKLLGQTRTESNDINVSTDMEPILADPVKPNYFDYIDNIGFRSKKDIENRSQSMNLSDYSQKTQSIENNNNTLNNDTIEARKRTSVSTIANTISEHVQKESHTYTEINKSQKSTVSNTAQSTEAPQVNFISSEKETRIVKVTPKIDFTATELSPNLEELSSPEIDLLPSYLTVHKNKIHVAVVDDNYSLKHSRAVTPFRLYLQEGDPCYCLYRIKSGTSKLFIKHYILMSIILFCDFFVVYFYIDFYIL